MQYPIPHASSRAWLNHRRGSPQNAGLVFDRFAPDWGVDSDKEAKKKALKEVQEAAKRADGNLLKASNRRWEATVRASGAEPFALKTDWRFVAGLGRKGPLEVGFTFHRYGFPILPGSGVKGIARAYAWLVEGRRETDPDFVAILGRASEGAGDDTGALSGGAIFFDAVPVELPKLELDVINPHYPEYYQGKEPPTNWQSPVPVYFLTVAPGTPFRFAVGWRWSLDDETRRLRDLAQDWLMKGLVQLGAGAKTSAGYGYFVRA